MRMSSFWQSQSVVIIFLRRFGCELSRLGAMQISLIKPLLAAHGVDLVAVGFEELGVKEFIEKKFFDGGSRLIA